jgi:hypothetical protein
LFFCVTFAGSVLLAKQLSVPKAAQVFVLLRVACVGVACQAIVSPQSSASKFSGFCLWCCVLLALVLLLPIFSPKAAQARVRVAFVAGVYCLLSVFCCWCLLFG